MGVALRAGIALGAAVAFLVIACGWRMVLQRRWTGSTGFVLGRFGKTPAERLVALMMAMSAGGIAVAIGAGLAGNPLGGAEPVNGAIVAAAIAAALIAIASTFWAQLAMGASWRIGLDRTEQTELVTGGPFQYVRNPIYTSMALFTGALCALLPGPAMAVSAAALLIGVEVVVRRVEEPWLRERHEPAYTRWARRAGRFVPGLGVARPHV